MENKGIGSGTFLKEFFFLQLFLYEDRKVTLSLISFKLNAAVFKNPVPVL